MWILDEPRLRLDFAIQDAVFRKVILKIEGQLRFLELLLNLLSAVAKALNVNCEFNNLVKVRVIAHHY